MPIILSSLEFYLVPLNSYLQFTQALILLLTFCMICSICLFFPLCVLLYLQLWIFFLPFFLKLSFHLGNWLLKSAFCSVDLIFAFTSVVDTYSLDLIYFYQLTLENIPDCDCHPRALAQSASVLGFLPLCFPSVILYLAFKAATFMFHPHDTVG